MNEESNSSVIFCQSTVRRRKLSKLICGLVASLKFKDNTFVELKDVVQNPLKPKSSDIVQRYKFTTRGQQQGELGYVHILLPVCVTLFTIGN